MGQRASESMIGWSAARMSFFWRFWIFWNPSIKDHHVCWLGRCHWGWSSGATESNTARQMTVICRHLCPIFLTKHSLIRSWQIWRCDNLLELAPSWSRLLCLLSFDGLVRSFFVKCFPSPCSRAHMLCPTGLSRIDTRLTFCPRCTDNHPVRIRSKRWPESLESPGWSSMNRAVCLTFLSPCCTCCLASMTRFCRRNS